MGVPATVPLSEAPKPGVHDIMAQTIGSRCSGPCFQVPSDMVRHEARVASVLKLREHARKCGVQRLAAEGGSREKATQMMERPRVSW